MKKMVFVPAGGLANRMRAMAASYTLARKVGVEMKAVWFRDWALNAPFHALFEPIQQEGLSIRDASFVDCLTLDRPRRKNLFVPRLYQRLMFRDALYEARITPLRMQHFDFEAWFRQGGIYLASYTDFYPYDYDLLRKLFVPLPDVKRQIDAFAEGFSSHTIGVHIRRTDNKASILQSPTELFVDAIDKEVEQNDDTVIFLATDSEAIKDEMRSRYGKRLLTAGAEADRNSIAGIKGGIVDMYSLARTNRIYGSFQSSFSELASQIGGVEVHVLRKH
ncbi:MAG: glycosyl transferase [Bacteroidaceae bacterium]